MRIIRNYDVASYYPHLMTIYGYTSRNIPSPDTFKEVLETRMKAKASGDKTTANALKLVVNTTYGAMLNQHNDLNDPLKGRSVCITGQLFLFELANHLYIDIPDLKVIQVNTDGVMVEFDDAYYEQVLAITREWEERTGFTLEEDKVVQIAQKDVNNYIEIQENGDVKTKGGYLVRGIAKAGAFKVNNDANIIATAIREYFVNNIPVEDTINACDDPKEFQLIAKASTKYSRAFQIVDGKEVEVQKANRVFATTDEKYGTLYKVKKETDAVAKIAGLPDHVMIHNEAWSEIDLKDTLDKSWYIAQAQKKVNDFIGDKEVKMAEKKTTSTKSTPKKNVHQKLAEARMRFLQDCQGKSGKNMQIGFKYFELADIVPVATQIFLDLGLIACLSITPEMGGMPSTAQLNVINTDKPEEKIDFFVPYTPVAPIINKSGKEVDNAMQRTGSSITYIRRYLYMIALDIVEADDIEPNITKDNTEEPEKTTKKTTVPASKEKREEIKDELTASDDQATDLQIKSLKKALSKLKKAKPDKQEFVLSVAEQTQAFTQISKNDCEALIQKVGDMLNE